MSNKNSTNEVKCPFIETDIEDAYGAEVSMFLHCHLRAYDKHGQGKFVDHEYYDKYGAPLERERSWEEGYHAVEKKLADYCNRIAANEKLDLPLIAGMGGGAHLYKPLHGRDNDEPWNIMGWIPLQRRWLSQGTFFSNRYFMGIRGNEIQNNLWDYHPHDEEEDDDPTDIEYSQLEPNDRYRGGYWYYRQPFGRYLHIIALKSPEEKPEECQRYNYIVHPLTYRPAIGTIPDNSVDAMQWCIINMPEEGHFGPGKDWGERCHGLEIFNDFSFFFSYYPIEKGGPNNGELGKDKKHTIDGDDKYYYYFDTYPLEFAVFLLDSALARGVYYHTMAANDAFYEKNVPEVQAADPKGKLHEHKQELKPKKETEVEAVEKPDEGGTDEEEILHEFVKDLPYGKRTVFGIVTLLDPRRHIRDAVFKEKCGIPCMGLDEGEKLAMQYLIKGRYFANTGIWDLFDYDHHSLPYKIHNQPDPDELCLEITEDMDLVFTFLPPAEKNANLVWRYTIMYVGDTKELETNHGYFKMNAKTTTKLDLRYYDPVSRVKWLYFTAIKPSNPSRRAWFHAIRGPAFGEPYLHARLPKLTHKVIQTDRPESGKDGKQKANPVTPSKEIPPTKFSTEKGVMSLNFAISVTDEDVINEDDICVYFMQVKPLQQNLGNDEKTEGKTEVSEKISQSSDLLPPRILQSVHGYFNLKKGHPTRLDLSSSWDKNTVLDNAVYFYVVDAVSGTPKQFPEKIEITLFGE